MTSRDTDLFNLCKWIEDLSLGVVKKEKNTKTYKIT